MRRSDGYALVELLLCLILMIFVGAAVVKAMQQFKATYYQQDRISTSVQANTVTMDIIKTIRNAKSIDSVTDDTLRLHVYDFNTWGPYDARAVTQPIQIIYHWSQIDAKNVLVRDVYNFDNSLKNTSVFFKDNRLEAPTSAQPYFRRSYVSGTGRILGVSVAFPLSSPWFPQAWIPLRAEGVLYGQGV